MSRSWTKAQLTAMQLHGCTLLVSAAAGSGKTATLTERIIRSLIGDDTHPGADLSRMLIVTFTRAAAAELKDRISSALTDAIAADPGNEHLTKQLLHLGDAQICTIDSFYLDPVRSHFAELGLPPQFRMADETELLPIREELMLDLMDQFYDRYQTVQNPSDPLDKIRDNEFAAMMDHISPTRDNGQRISLLLKLYGQLIRYPAGVNALSRYADELIVASGTDFLHTRFGEPLRNELIGALTSAKTFFEDACDFLANDALAAPYFAGFSHDLNAVDGLLSLLNGGGTYEHVGAAFTAYKKQRLSSANGLPADHPAQSLKAIRIAKNSWIEATAAKWFGQTANDISKQMLTCASFCRLLAEFLKEFDERYRALKTSRGICDFDDPRRFLLKLLQNDDGEVTPLAAELAARYDEVYIDEYQDVDEMQDTIFSLIGGDHRFMVGDIKQSIYGFRGAEPSVFAGYRQAFSAITPSVTKDPTADGCSIFMSDNFRCDKPVIDFTNLVCGFTFSACRDSIGYREEDALICSKKNPAGTEYSPVTLAIFEKRAAASNEEDVEGEKKDTEASAKDSNDSQRGEAIWVANEISHLLRNCRKNDGTPILPGDIAILMRNYTHVSSYTDALDALGIPNFSEGSQSTDTDPDLTLLTALLDVIDNPQNDVSLEAVLTSDLFGMTLEDLIRIRQSAGRSFSLYGALRRLAGREEEPDDGTENDLTIDQKTAASCRAFSEWLTKWQRAAVSQSADRFVRNLWRDDRLSGYAESNAALVIYDYARRYQDTAYNGLYSFLRYLKRLLADGKIKITGRGEHGGAVTLLSIHHSKGLEYPVCFVCGLGTQFNHRDENDDLIFHRKIGLTSKFYNADTMIKTDTALRRSAALLRRKDQNEEEMRILYVAMTRARERLYLTGTLRSGNYEKAEARAGLIRPGDDYAIRNVDCALDWILAALLAAPSLEGLDYNLIVEDKATQIAGTPFKTEKGKSVASVSPAMDRYLEVLTGLKDFVDPNERVRKIPNKINASGASPTWLEERDAERNRTVTERENRDLLDERAKWMHDAHRFLYQGELTAGTPSSAERGTAIHAFLQFCDWHRIAEYGVKNEVQRLLDQGFLRQTDLDLIPKGSLETLETSDLLKMILGAVKVTREFRFSRILPLTDFTSSDEMRTFYGGQTVFLQGSLDLLLEMPGGELILCDYKTDRVRTEKNETPDRYAERMRESHGMQLKLYADAVEAIFGRRPGRIFVYSIPLQQLIPM